MAEYLKPNLEIRKSVMDRLGRDLNICFQCGGCTGVCPWGEVSSPFNPRKILRKTAIGIGDLSDDETWLCVTCDECVDHCPHQIDIPEVMMSLRGLSVEEAKMPKEYQDVLESTFRLGNPWGGSVKARTEWSEGMDVEEYDGQDVLWWVGCTEAYDDRNQDVARAFANVLNSIGVSYGTLGRKEKCAGASIRRMGEEGLFQELMEYNTEVLNDSGAKRVVATSPHAFHTFKNEYPDLDIEFMHHSQLLHDVIEDFKFVEDFDHTVVYKDPCYLGRHNGIYEEPREVLNSVPGLNLVEMERNREMALCCGGGGGRIWAETDPEKRFSNVVLEDALDIGADVLATACPFCMLNFEDSAKVLNVEDEIEIMDISEILWSVM